MTEEKVEDKHLILFTEKFDHLFTGNGLDKIVDLDAVQDEDKNGITIYIKDKVRNETIGTYPVRLNNEILKLCEAYNVEANVNTYMAKIQDSPVYREFNSYILKHKEHYCSMKLMSQVAINITDENVNLQTFDDLINEYGNLVKSVKAMPGGSLVFDGTNLTWISDFKKETTVTQDIRSYIVKGEFDTPFTLLEKFSLHKIRYNLSEETINRLINAHAMTLFTDHLEVKRTVSLD